jgi:hypothetical protein
MVVGDSCSTDTDILALSQPLKPKMHEAEMPNLTTVIDETSFTGIRIDLENLDYLDLEVEIEALTLFLRSIFFRDCS